MAQVGPRGMERTLILDFDARTDTAGVRAPVCGRQVKISIIV